MDFSTIFCNCFQFWIPISLLLQPICPVQSSRQKQRNFSTTMCFACLTKPPIYSTMNTTELHRRLRRGGIQISGHPHVKTCRDTPVTMRPDFSGAYVMSCGRRNARSGVCVKLTGTFQGEPYVFRSCWEKMWRDPRGFNTKESNECYTSGLSFVDTEHNELCFCDTDLCNRTSRATAFGAIVILCFLTLTLHSTNYSLC